MAIKHSITLSTTEPNNEVGVIKIRQADEQTQMLDVQITENGVPKSYTGLAVYFCAKLGQTAGLGIIEQKLKTEEMTNPANGKLEYTMRDEDWQILGRQRGYFSFRKMKDEHEFVEQFTTRDFTYNVIPSVTGEIKEVKKDGSTYIWTIEEMIRLFKEYISTGKIDWENYKNDEKAAWEKFVEDNREFLETADPGGKIILELLGARGGATTLGERLDSDKAEVTAQLAQIVNVNVSDFGLVGDGITDNTEKMIMLNSYLESLTDIDRINILFPRGVYVTGVGLVAGFKHVAIKGDNAFLIKKNNTYFGESIGIHVIDSETIEIKGLEMKNSVIDKITPVESNDVNGSRFYHIWVDNRTIPLKHLDISSNIFHDDVSMPNREKKPYNGQIWIGGYYQTSENIYVYNNVFNKPCGRIVYITNAKNIFVYNNIIEEVHYLPYTPIYQSTVTFVFRMLSSDNIHIYNNVVKGTKHNSAGLSVRIFEINANDDGSSGTRIPSTNVNVHDNDIEVNNISQCEVIRLESVENGSYHNNRVVMNDNTQFIVGRPLNAEHTRYLNISIRDNEILNTNNEPCFINTVGGSSEKVSLLVENNIFYSELDLTSLGYIPKNDSLVITRDNKYYRRNEYVGILSGDINYLQYDSVGYYRFGLSNNNIPARIVDGVLTLPNRTTHVSFLTTVDTPSTEITDVKFESPLINEGTKVTLLHLSGAGSGNIVFKNDPTKMRLTGASDVVLSIYKSVELTYIGGIWYVTS